MTLIDTIAGWFAGGGGGKGKAYIVDASRLDDQRRTKKAPREQIEVMKRLGRFAEKEELHIEAIFEGEPLRVAGDGQEFQGIRVYYTGDKHSLSSLILRRLKRNRGRDVIVITADREIDDAVHEAGGQVMSPSTFRKGLGSDGGSGGGRDDGKSSGNRRRRKPRRRKPKGSKGPRGDEKKSGDGNSEEARVRELIDLVE